MFNFDMKFRPSTTCECQSVCMCVCMYVYMHSVCMYICTVYVGNHRHF